MYLVSEINTGMEYVNKTRYLRDYIDMVLDADRRRHSRPYDIRLEDDTLSAEETYEYQRTQNGIQNPGNTE